LTQELSDAYFTSMSTFRDHGLSAVLSEEMRSDLGGYTPRQKYHGLFQAVQERSPLEQMQWVDMHSYLPGDILVKADRATMAYSLEARSPWLDYRLAEFALRIPDALKIHGSTGKHIFKQAMEPYVPRQLLERTKKGFSVPLAQWFRAELKPLFQSLVMNREMDEFVSPAEVKRIWNEHQCGLSNHERKLWNLLMLAAWAARHGQGRHSGGACMDLESPASVG
jgi:asparagine synthase (glutamine-hydrolysing)